MDEQTKVRLDKWLWACRFYKTRRIAIEMIESGKVRYSGAKIKPSKMVEINAILTIRQGDQEKTVQVLKLLEKRVSAPLSLEAYQETSESIEKRQKLSELKKLGALTMPHPDRKPDKKERRHLIHFKNNQL